MNILVTGANGQLGRSLRLAAAGSDDKYTFTDIGELDITDAAAVDKAVLDTGAELLVNCAAYTDVNRAESDEALARKLNAEAPGILASAMERHGGAIIHISTDYVFGGLPYNTPMTEDQPTSPLGVYGKTKLEGEQLVRSANPRHVIIRTAWLYSEYGRNFVKTMLDLTARMPQVKVVFDQAGTPTYAPDLSRAIVRIVEALKTPEADECYGTYHYSDEGVCSWYDVARRIAVRAGRGGNVVTPCHSSEFPSPVERPAYSVLDKTKIKERFGAEVPYWTDSIDTCIGNLLNG